MGSLCGGLVLKNTHAWQGQILKFSNYFLLHPLRLLIIIEVGFFETFDCCFGFRAVFETI